MHHRHHALTKKIAPILNALDGDEEPDWKWVSLEIMQILDLTPLEHPINRAIAPNDNAMWEVFAQALITIAERTVDWKRASRILDALNGYSFKDYEQIAEELDYNNLTVQQTINSLIAGGYQFLEKERSPGIEGRPRVAYRLLKEEALV